MAESADPSARSDRPRPGFHTRAIHAGQSPDPSTGAVMPPVYLTSTYVQEAPGVHKGYEYSRTANPTRTALQGCLADLEGGAWSLAFASGLAATQAVLTLLSSGDRIILGHDVYGGTYRLVAQVMARWGLRYEVVDTTDLDALRRALEAEPTQLVWFESPTNPLLHVTDIQAACELAKAAGALSVVDNTFATPYLQAPLDLGADLVVHSTTKYLGGHSDVVGGAVVGRDDTLRERLAFLQNAVGAVPGPLDCFLVLRGIKTLPLRMERHADSAEQVAAWLGARPQVARVHYPGRSDHPGHAVAAKQMRRFGGMVSFELDADLDAAIRFASATRLFALAESLGGVESLLDHPASMTHASVPREEREAHGFKDGLLRLSVGLENVDDLLADLEIGFGAAFQ
ncbi:MAG: cystathionine gamma-synthase [Planctomycetota bacterium]|jgi:cystathionine beta-lyase/cystathionine gamma-synthase